MNRTQCAQCNDGAREYLEGQLKLMGKEEATLSVYERAIFWESVVACAWWAHHFHLEPDEQRERAL